MMQSFDSYLLAFIVALPLAGAALLMSIPSSRPRLVLRAAMSVALAVMLLSLYAFVAYDHQEGGFQFTRTWKWLELPGPWPLGDQGISLALGVDGISALMLMLSGIVTFAGVVVSGSISERSKDFFVLYFLLMAGVVGVLTAMDLFFFFFFYELAVVPMYLLIGVWGSGTDFRSFVRTKEYGAMKLTLYVVAGSVLVWIALLAVFVEAGLGTFSLVALREGGEFPKTFQQVFFPLMMVGFGVLAGMWPFHTWSPDGHVAAPTAVSMVHAGVVMKLGAYGILRVGIGLLPQGAEDWMPVLVGLGTINVIYGAVSAIGQRDLKYSVGYLSISHMGYVLMGIATLHHLGISGAVLQMFSHGIMVALFFAVVGAIYDRTHTRDIGALEGMAKRMGVIAAFFAIAGFASLGMPGFSGFVAALLVFLGLFQTYPLLGVLGVASAAITAVYILRLISKVFFGPLGDRWWDQTDVTGSERLSLGLLASFIFLLGLLPFPFIRAIDSGVSSVLSQVAGLG